MLLSVELGRRGLPGPDGNLLLPLSRVKDERREPLSPLIEYDRFYNHKITMNRRIIIRPTGAWANVLYFDYSHKHVDEKFRQPYEHSILFSVNSQNT